MIHTNRLIAARRQSDLADWAARHELFLFFASTLLFSWLIWGILAQVPVENQATFSRIILIGAFAPSLSAILISSITNTGARKAVSARWWPVYLWAVFLLALVLTAGIEWLNNIWWGHTFDASLILADAILVILAALVITRLLTNRADAQLRITGMTQWRVWPWILAALGFWPLLVLVGNTTARLLALQVPANPTWPDIPFPLILLQSFFWALLFGGPLNEEPGWRGFALPRLQRRFSPLVASIILGVIWGLWHVPQHLWGMYPGGPLGAVLRLQEIPRAILFTWLYNRTKGNLLVMLVFHAAINTTSYFMARSYEVVFILCFVVVIPFIVADKMWRRGDCRPVEVRKLTPGRAPARH